VRPSFLGTTPLTGTIFDVALSPVFVDPRLNRARTPVLPAVARGREFEVRFDHLTLFYDVFRENGETSILAIGPHLPSHFDPDVDVQFCDLVSGERLNATYLPSRGHIHGDMYRIMANAGTSSLHVSFGNQHAIVAVQPNLSLLFAGRRVLTNRGQNDPIEWLVDWAWFHAREFGFDAIVHYDNGSTAYRAEDVRHALARVPGIEVVVVLPWPYPMEPPHASIPATGELFWHQLKDRWAESARLEHQRRRFLERAEMVLVADTDELIIQRNPRLKIDDLFANTEVAWVRFTSEIVVNTADLPDRLLHHRDLYWLRDEAAFKTPKYLVKPDRCPDEARWWLHDIAWAPGVDVSPDDYFVAHFIALTTGWGGKGSRAEKQTPAPGIHHPDIHLRGKLARVFNEYSDGSPDLRSHSGANPHLLRKKAHELIGSGNRPAALGRLTEAIALDPYHPIQHEVRKTLLAEEDS